ERHDADGHRLLTDEALDRPEEASVIDAARRRERPDEDAGERERHDAEPDRPVDGAEDARRRRPLVLLLLLLLGSRRIGFRGVLRFRLRSLLLLVLFFFARFRAPDASPPWIR